MNIPIYRAKKIDSDEYITGYLYKNGDFVTVHNIRIDPPTLAIHFPDIINTNSEKVWYSMEEISNIIKGYENDIIRNRNISLVKF